MSRQHRVCVICGLQEKRSQEKIFYARFPLDEYRCKKWVKVTGIEDLAYIPIEKLHQNKYICGKHFKQQDFKNKKTQLKKTAVPTTRLTALPLSDEILTGFPCHIHSDHLRSHDGTTSKQGFYGLLKPKPSITSTHITDAAKEADADIEMPSTSSGHELEETFQALQDSPDEQCEIDSEAPVEIQSDQSFSWQKSNQAESLLDLPVEVLKLESSDGDKKGKASVPMDEQLQCCECRRVIPEHSVRCVCVSCTDGDICSVCAADDKHSYHYALRVPAIATQSEVREVLLKIRRVLLEESIIKEEIKEEDDDPLSSATHIVGDASYEDSISQVPNVDIQGCYGLPKSTQKMNRVEEIFKSSDEDPSEVFKGSSPRKRRRSETQYQTDVPRQISKEPSVVKTMLKLVPSPKESEQNQDKRTKQKTPNLHKINIGIMKRLLRKRIILQRLGPPQKQKPLTILDIPQEMKPVTIVGAVQKKQFDTNLEIIQIKDLNIKKIEDSQPIIHIKDLNIKKIEDLQPKRITLKRSAQTAPVREEGPSTSNETMNILPTKKIII